MVLKGGYPFWFDDVPKGMSRDQYKRLEKKKPKNKSMKVWIREKKKNMKKYTKRRENIKKKRKITRKRKVSQKGGFVPCLTCLGPVAAFAGGALGGASFVMKSSSSKSSISNINGKRSMKRKEKYKISKNGNTHKREFKQINKRVYDGKKMSDYDNLKEANEAYNSLIKKCKSKGFQKC